MYEQMDSHPEVAATSRPKRWHNRHGLLHWHKSNFSWLVCPTLGFIDDFIDWAEEAISKQLTVDLGPQDTRDKLQDSWQIVARFSSGILVAIALVMVIATALGSDLISPYALKKVLPRLVLGAIGIWLSWALVSTYIDIMNDLGRGIAGIMLSPFAEAKEFNLQNIAGRAGAASAGGGEEALFVALATAGIISAGIFGLLGLGLTALMAFTVAIVILALRQAVIIFLVIVAPFAFAMSILPNTQKVWKLWSGTLNKLLLMFPMIMALLAAGKIFAYITSESLKNPNISKEERFMGFAISLIAYVAPYFFLPALFKAAGGLFSNLTGMVNNKGKGIFDKARGSLDKRKATSNRELASKAREGRRLANRNKDFASGLAATGVVGDSLAKYRRLRAGGLSSKGRRDIFNSAMTSQRTAADKDLETSVGGDSDVLEVVAMGGVGAYRDAKLKSLKGQLGKTINQAQYDQKIVEMEAATVRASSQARQHFGDKNSQAAALQRLSAMGQAGDTAFEAVAKAFSSDPASAQVIVGAAARESKAAGNLSSGALKYDFQTKTVGWGKILNRKTNQMEDMTKVQGVKQAIQTMSAEDKAKIKTDYDQLNGVIKFKDSGMMDALKADPSFAGQLLADSNVYWTQDQKDILSDYASRTPPTTP